MTFTESHIIAYIHDSDTDILIGVIYTTNYYYVAVPAIKKFKVRTFYTKQNAINYIGSLNTKHHEQNRDT